MPTLTTPTPVVPAPPAIAPVALPASVSEIAAAAPRLPFGLFLGLRYLRPRRTFVSIITLISVTGVALGVALLIIVISVMSGYDRELHEKILGFEPHLTVINENGFVENWQEVRKTMLATPGVIAAAPVMRGPVLVDHENRRFSPEIIGVPPELVGTILDVPSLMVHGHGEWDLDGEKAVVGVDLAHTLNVKVGDRLTIYSPRNLESLVQELDKLKDQKATDQQIGELRSLVVPTEVTVTGIFDSGRAPFDSQHLFVPLYLGQEIYELGGMVHGVAAKTADPYHAERTKRALLDQLQSPLNARTWIDENAPLFNAIQVERMTMAVLLSVVVVVAAFCVMITLITVTVQKTREIGIMKAVGASEEQIVGVFLWQGMVVGFLGAFGGLGLGLGVLRALNPFKNWMQRQFGVEVFSRQVYGFADLPYWTRWEDVAMICSGAFLLCLLAAWVPARQSARRDPVKSLRFE